MGDRPRQLKIDTRRADYSYRESEPVAPPPAIAAPVEFADALLDVAAANGEIVPFVAPEGDVAIVDGRRITEAQFERWGRSNFKLEAMAKLCEASVPWLMAAMREYPWIQKAYDRGRMVWDSDLVKDAEGAIQRGIVGGTKKRQVWVKDEGVKELVDEIPGDGKLALEVAARRSPDVWGDRSTEEHGKVSTVVMNQIHNYIIERGGKLAPDIQPHVDPHVEPQK